MLSDLAREENLALLVVFGSTAKGVDRPGDLDLALLSEGGWLCERPPDLWHRWVAALGRGDLDLVWLPNAGWLVSQQVAQFGRPLFEARPGEFRRFQIASHLRSVDADVWRRRMRGFVLKSLEGILQLNRDLIQKKLTQIALHLSKLEQYLQGDDWALGPLQYASERMLELLVGDAATVNTEVAQAVANIPPSDYYSSFFSMAQAGWLSQEAAAALAPLTRIRNVLVHHYEDIQPAALRQALEASMPHWRDYLEAVQNRLS